jgi:hypothetical protein
VPRFPSPRQSATMLPRPRPVASGVHPADLPPIRRGVDALQLLEVAAPPRGLSPGSLMLGFAVGALVATRRRAR